MYNPGPSSGPRSVPVALLDEVVMIRTATIICLLFGFGGPTGTMPPDITDPQHAVVEVILRVQFD
jgi:hypothetical protein